jgi:hypothetical protein
MNKKSLLIYTKYAIIPLVQLGLTTLNGLFRVMVPNFCQDSQKKCQRIAEGGSGKFVTYSKHHKILERKYVILHHFKTGTFTLLAL